MCDQKLKYVRTGSGKVLIVVDFQSLKAAVRAFYEEVEQAHSLLVRWPAWQNFLSAVLTAGNQATLIDTVNGMLSTRTFSVLVPDLNRHKIPDWLAQPSS